MATARQAQGKHAPGRECQTGKVPKPFFFTLLSAIAARTSAVRAGASIASPSRILMARRTLPSMLALNRPRVIERGTLGEGHLYHRLVRLAGADDPVMRPDRHAAPFPFFNGLRVGHLDDGPKVRERIAASVAQRRDPLVDALGWRFFVRWAAVGHHIQSSRSVPLRTLRMGVFRAAPQSDQAPTVRASTACTTSRVATAAPKKRLLLCKIGSWLNDGLCMALILD